jgi:5-methylcytosine-specific restriction protein A
MRLNTACGLCLEKREGAQRSERRKRAYNSERHRYCAAHYPWCVACLSLHLCLGLTMCPSAIPRPCRHPGCPGKTTVGLYCDKHYPQYQRAKDARIKRSHAHDTEYHDRLAFYRSTAWQRARTMHLHNCPICVTLGCGILATEVDHIVPMIEGGEPLDDANLQSLCKGCHSRKTLREVRASGRLRRGVVKG